jgi:hypothetical protein
MKQDTQDAIEALSREIGTPRTPQQLADFTEALLVSEAVERAIDRLLYRQHVSPEQAELILHPGDERNPRVALVYWRENDATEIHEHRRPFAIYVYGGSVIEEIYDTGEWNRGGALYPIAEREIHAESLLVSGPATHRVRTGSNPRRPHAFTLHVRMLTDEEREPQTNKSPWAEPWGV